MQLVDLCMQRVAARVQFGEPPARLGEIAFELRDSGFLAGDCLVQHFQFLFARDDAGMPGFAAGNPDPVTAEPDAVPGDDRLPRPQRLAPRYRIRQRFHGDHAAEQPGDDRGPGDSRCQRFGIRLRAAGAPRFGDRQLARAQRVHGLRDRVDFIDANRLEIAAERSLDRALPALVDLEPLREPAGSHRACGPRAIPTCAAAPFPSAAFCTASTVRNSLRADWSSALAASSAAAPWRSASRSACRDASAASSSACASRPRSRASLLRSGELVGFRARHAAFELGALLRQPVTLRPSGAAARRRSARCAPVRPRRRASLPPTPG